MLNQTNLKNFAIACFTGTVCFVTLLGNYSQAIAVNFGSISRIAANRDPALFEAPETLQCSRGNACQHLTFGYGVHYCVGPLLARLQFRSAVTRVAKRFPEMRLVSAWLCRKSQLMAFACRSRFWCC